jgi:hypothetical protein
MNTWRDRTVAFLFLSTTTALAASLSGACTFTSQGQGGDAGAPQPGYAVPGDDGGNPPSANGDGAAFDGGATGGDGSPGCPPGDNGCGPPVTICGPGNCPGCCDSNGACQYGRSNQFCGLGGSSCMLCNPPSSCGAGVCQATGCGPGNCPGCCATDGTCVSGADNAACGTGGGACLMCPTGSSCRGPQGCSPVGNTPCLQQDGGPLDLNGTWTGTSNGPGGAVSATLMLASMGPGSYQYQASLSLDPSVRGDQCPASGPINSTFVASLTPNGPSGSGCMLNGNISMGAYTSGIMLQASPSMLIGNASPACSAPPFNGTLVP